MDMTEDEKISAYRMRVFYKFTWNLIARIMFPEAYETAPNLCGILLEETVRAWYRKPGSPEKAWACQAV